jgi:DNA mismatch repair protein MutS
LAELPLFAAHLPVAAPTAPTAAETAIAALDLDGMSPREAMETLWRLKAMVE